jgi:endonuclease VIII
MEGPSLVILREELESFRGKKVLKVAGNTKQPKESLAGRVLRSIDTWGKQLFLTFSGLPSIVTRTHFLMFGSYQINHPKPGRFPRLELQFRNGAVYFYACSIKFGVRADVEQLDRRVDLMSPDWTQRHVVNLMCLQKDAFLCDLFLDQSIFAGSGNIVKNEVLFNIRRHPLTKLSGVSSNDWPRMAEAVHEYCWNFYEWKKKFELRKHWQVYRRSRCPLCDTTLVRANLGKFLRKSFYCPEHQVLPARPSKLRVFPVLPIQSPGEPERTFNH